MGLFDFLKKKPSIPATENISLEELLKKAATDPTCRPEFYKRLLNEELVVITNNSSELQIEDGILQKDSKVAIVNFDDGKIPVFTSTDRIFDKNVVKEQVPYLQLKGENLFTMTKGATLILNPFSDYGKELLPEEINDMLDGSIMHPKRSEVEIKKDTQILIGQPAKRPTEMLNDIGKFLASQEKVKAAYLAWIKFPDDTPPHYLIAIDIEERNTIVNNGIGELIFKHLGSEPVDIIKLENDGGISDYFYKNQVAPFYKK